MSKNIKKIGFLSLVLIVCFNFVMANAKEVKHPADILSQLTGKSIEEIKSEHNKGKSYGEIAKNYGVLDKFKDVKLSNRKERIDKLVIDGKISKEEAQQMYDQYKEYIEKWDGSGKLEGKCKGGRRNISPNREEK
ncbi:MAG: hypothetical protein ACRC7N_12660 [Clostridium sp.]